ncbi:MAG TPA: thioredoxin domain-containing protein [Armatimonadota bacterium]|jgi:hypothetical protein
MALYEEFSPQPNRLLDAQSTYLRSAAYQPVGWYPFGPEAFEEARRQDKPILLDIGASWCHWCHVIDRESYDNAEIATILNERFIPIKVDRDERPDIDARYQAAVQLLTGQGGWPLTVFLTPDGQPFYGGTYFPPEDRYGRVGFKSLLPTLADAYAHRRHELEATARALAERARHAAVRMVGVEEISEETLQHLLHNIQARFNEDEGGFEREGPKFPHSGAITLALQQWDVTGDAHWRTIVERTLRAMGEGGFTDQLGGGFHRYSTDAHWTVPHFEKMGYDNALLLTNYSAAYRAFGDPFYREVAAGALGYLLDELADHARGGFYSTQDADIDLQDDGSYWTWSLAEISEALLPEEAEVLARYYAVRQAGNMPETGRTVLHIATTPAAIAAQLNLPLEMVEERITQGRHKLLAVRRKRRAPQIDTNKFANWNALMVSGCLQAGSLLGREDAIHFALRTVTTLLHDAYEPDHGMYHNFHTAHGACLPGFFEDQAAMAVALLDAFAVSGEQEHLATARHLLDLCLAQYWDEEHGAFFDVARDQHDVASVPYLQHARKVIEDMPTPAPNALAALALDRMALLTGEERYRTAARRTLEAFAGHAPAAGPFAAYYGLALSAHLHHPLHVVIVGRADNAHTQALRQTALSVYRPGKLVSVFPPDAPLLPYPADAHGRPIAYVCAGEQCAEPTLEEERLREMLETFGR